MLTEGLFSFSQHELNRQCYSLNPLPILPGFEDVLNLWDSKRNGHLLPAWDNFQFDDFGGVHSRVSVSEKEDNDFRFKIYGSDFARLRDRDLTNKLLCASVGVNWKGGAYAYFAEISKGPYIGRTQGVVPDARCHLVKINSIDLPLGEDGKNVSHCLHVIDL
ncbi:hypothetical protein [Kiloniella antarctica]|uniref:Uncharacterized protein n=1 Tax=Kiloniella antarctica TaxID=1550907 RepID=A0ABW5BHF6_9PROT